MSHQPSHTVPLRPSTLALQWNKLSGWVGAAVTPWAMHGGGAGVTMVTIMRCTWVWAFAHRNGESLEGDEVSSKQHKRSGVHPFPLLATDGGTTNAIAVRTHACSLRTSYSSSLVLRRLDHGSDHIISWIWNELVSYPAELERLSSLAGYEIRNERITHAAARAWVVSRSQKLFPPRIPYSHGSAYGASTHSYR